MLQHAEQIKTLVDSSWRYHIVALLMALGVAFFALEQATRASSGLQGIKSQEKQIISLTDQAESVSSYLRQFILADYGEIQEERLAILTLIKDLRYAKRNLMSIEETLQNAKWPSIEERIELNRYANISLALHHYNAPDALAVATHLDGEPALIAAESNEGTLSFSRSIDEMTLEDLTRLTYAASVRPSHLKSLRERSPNAPMSKEDYKPLLELLRTTAEEATKPYSREARSATSKLWISWLRSSQSADPQQEAAIRKASLHSLRERFADLQKAALAAEDQAAGRNYFQLPVVGQNLSVIGAIWLLPFVIMAMHALSAVGIWQALRSTAGFGNADTLGGVTSPFLLIYPGPGAIVSLATFIQFMVAFLPFCILVAIGLLSPVVAAQAEQRIMLWIIIPVPVVLAAVLFMLVRQLSRVMRDRLGIGG